MSDTEAATLQAVLIGDRHTSRWSRSSPLSTKRPRVRREEVVRPTIPGRAEPDSDQSLEDAGRVP